MGDGLKCGRGPAPQKVGRQREIAEVGAASEQLAAETRLPKVNDEKLHWLCSLFFLLLRSVASRGNPMSMYY